MNDDLKKADFKARVLGLFVPGGSLPVRAVAEYLMVSDKTAHAIMADFIAAGLVASKVYGTSVSYSITEAGRAEAAKK